MRTSIIITLLLFAFGVDSFGQTFKIANGGLSLNGKPITNQTSISFISKELNEISREYSYSKNSSIHDFMFDNAGIIVRCYSDKIQSIQLTGVNANQYYERKDRHKYPVNSFKGTFVIKNHKYSPDSTYIIPESASIYSIPNTWIDFVKVSRNTLYNWNLLIELKDNNYKNLCEGYSDWEKDYKISYTPSKNDCDVIRMAILRRYLICCPDGVFAKHATVLSNSLYLSSFKLKEISDSNLVYNLFNAKYKDSRLIDNVDFEKLKMQYFNICYLGFGYNSNSHSVINIKKDTITFKNETNLLPTETKSILNFTGGGKIFIRSWNHNDYSLPYFISQSDVISITPELGHTYILFINNENIDSEKIKEATKTWDYHSFFQYTAGQYIGYIEIKLVDYFNNNQIEIISKQIGLYSGETK